MSLDLTLGNQICAVVIIAGLNGVILLTQVPFRAKYNLRCFLGFGTSQYMLFQRQD
jgi:hypothetical protein